MRRGIVRLVAAAVILTGASLAFAFSTGPPASRTGAPAIGGVAAEGVCTACHTTFPLNAPGATLTIDAPANYEPFVVYTLHVRMTSTFALPRRWGFQITAVREADGQGAGLFDGTGFNGVQVVSGSGAFATRRYMEHTSVGTFDNDPGPVEWSFLWQAPGTDLGRIIFFCAGNAANSSGTNSGDHIYTTSKAIDFSPPTGVPGPVILSDALEAPRPNPFVETTTLSFSRAAAGPSDLTVFDVQGRRVRTLVTGHQTAGRGAVAWDGRRDDGTRAKPGVYLVRLTAPGRAGALVRRVTLAR